MNKEEDLREVIVDLREYSTDYTKSRCEEIATELEDVLKENEELKTDYVNKVQVERDLLKQENEEIQHEYNKKMNYLSHKYVTLQNAYNYAKIKNKNLQNRIDKAIEYIEEEIKMEAFHHYLDDEDLNELLQILKGSDE
jgi:hypothetical protein